MNEEHLNDDEPTGQAEETGPEGGGAASAAPEHEAAASAVPAVLGATRYVLAAFFAGGILAALLVGKVLLAGWNRLADSAWVSQRFGLLSRLGEDERSTWTMLLGAVAGTIAAVYAYRREDVRGWANEVAAELAKVTWPSKREVTNSTVVVVLTGTFATAFLTLLDRFWGFVTNLVYGT